MHSAKPWPAVVIAVLVSARCGHPVDPRAVESRSITLSFLFKQPDPARNLDLGLVLAAERACERPGSFAGPVEGGTGNASIAPSGRADVNFSSATPSDYGCSSFGYLRTFSVRGLIWERSAMERQAPVYAPGTFVVYSLHDGLVQPWSDVSPVAITSGFSVLKRGCDESGARTLVNSPISEPIELAILDDDELGEDERDPEGREGAFLKRCGWARPPVMLGRRISVDRAETLRFTGDEKAIAYLSPAARSTAILRTLNVGSGATTDVVAGDLMGPLALTRNAQGANWAYLSERGDRVTKHVRVSLETGALERLDLQLAGYPSPDGRWIAGADLPPPGGMSKKVFVIEVETGSRRELGFPGNVLGWSSTSESLFIEGETLEGCRTRAVRTDGAVAADLGPCLFPKVVLDDGQYEILPERDWWVIQRLPGPGAPESAVPAGACGLGSHCPVGLVLRRPIEPVGRPVLTMEAGIVTFESAVANSPTHALFIWSKTCLGSFARYCTHRLNRISLVDGSHTVVATAHDELPFAVSPSGRMVALGAPEGIHVVDLP